MLSPKHYTFRLLDQTPRENLPPSDQIGMYLKAYMSFYVAQNKLQREMKGDENYYINMLAEEYAYNGVSSDQD